jgi:hypothetical protein
MVGRFSLFFLPFMGSQSSANDFLDFPNFICHNPQPLNLLFCEIIEDNQNGRVSSKQVAKSIRNDSSALKHCGRDGGKIYKQTDQFVLVWEHFFQIVPTNFSLQRLIQFFTFQATSARLSFTAGKFFTLDRSII